MTTEPTVNYPVTCPGCLKVRNATRPIPVGVKVRCKCGHTFIPVPMEVTGIDLSAMAIETMPSDLDVHLADAGPLNEAEGDHLSAAELEAGAEEDRVGVEREATLTDVWKVLNSIEASLLGVAVRGRTNANPREYKVVTQKDKWFSGKFDPDKVEGALNAYAKQGWVLKGVATASVPGFGGQRDEIVIIMER
jgi:Domain of unknown function (DUF4177)